MGATNVGALNNPIPVVLEQPKPREKKLLFTFNKEDKEVIVKADGEASAAKPDSTTAKPESSGPKASPIQTPAVSSAEPAAAALGKAAESEVRDRAPGPGTPRREHGQGGTHGQKNQSALSGKADASKQSGSNAMPDVAITASAVLPGVENVKRGSGIASKTALDKVALEKAPSHEKTLAPEKLSVTEKPVAPEKAVGGGTKKVPVDIKTAAAAPQPAVTKTVSTAQPAPVAAKAPAHDAGKLNGDIEKVANPVESLPPPAEPKISGSGKNEESSQQGTAKQATDSVANKDTNLSSIEPADATSVTTEGSAKELAKARESAPVVCKASETPEPDSGAPKTYMAKPLDVAAPKPVDTEAPLEATEAAAPPTQSKAARVPKPRPVLTDGERLVYEIDFILKFKNLCKEGEYGESVKSSVADKMNNDGGKGGGGRPGAGMMPGGGYQQGILPGPGGRGAGGGMPMSRDNRPPMGRDQPRGGGASGMRDRGGPARGGGGRGQPGYALISNYKPLEHTDNAFDPGKNRTQTAYGKVMKEARSILNKLTMTNFAKLSDSIAMLEIKETDELRGLVGIIFDKALEEGHFCQMYALLCNTIKDRMPEFQEDNPDLGETKIKKVTFKRCLLNKCQEEFERADRYDEATDAEVAGMNAAAKAAKSRRVRIRMLGNVKFIGELFRQEILNEKIMHDCVKRLLASKDEDTIECLCKLMATIGKQLDRKEAKQYMDFYFEQMQATANEISIQRLKFMILDTLDLRKNRFELCSRLVEC